MRRRPARHRVVQEPTTHSREKRTPWSAISSAGSVSRSTVPIPAAIGLNPPLGPADAATPSAITDDSETGPPRKTTDGAAAWSTHPSNMSVTGNSLGRVSTTPSAPSSLCSSMNTTVNSKFGSLSEGLATRCRPRWTCPIFACVTINAVLAATPPVVLAIAAHDPLGGAGLAADLTTFAASASTARWRSPPSPPSTCEASTGSSRWTPVSWLIRSAHCRHLFDCRGQDRSARIGRDRRGRR